ncbi:RTA1 like protein [Pleomassaria siparia CBS 279.74]|uniref:RTA1 like protein n=1 Tax=Pleomassaria siparia CBS 279.74 TaxID=1314801 RepID=A0A6G1JZK1_9PLEO|nr:RTA1 like protein [Pleomassaria siparia CBS 279.74]
MTFDFKMFRYIPSLAGAVVAMVVFTILAGLHFWQWYRTRQRIILCVVLGTLGEIGGYGARIASHYNNQAWAAFIVQGCLILIGPLFFAATIYMMLGRTIRLAGGEQVSIISPRWCTRLFITADISTLIIQGLGASIMGTMQLALAIAGEKIVIAGLALQVATFIVFVVVATDFHIRTSKKTLSAPYSTSTASNEWKKMLWILYSVSSLILFRCIFRLIEYAMGNASYLMAHEWCLYVFDMIPMVLVLVLMLVLQPTKYFPTKEERKMSGGFKFSEVSVIQSA